MKQKKYASEYAAYTSTFAVGTPSDPLSPGPLSYKKFVNTIKKEAMADKKKASAESKALDQASKQADKAEELAFKANSLSEVGSSFLATTGATAPDGVVSSGFKFPWSAVLLLGAAYFLIFKKGVK